MNEHNKTRINTLQDVARLLPELYSESSAKAYQAAFNRVGKLTGQELVFCAADEAAWGALSARIVWAGRFKGRTQKAAERAFETWRGKISAAIKRAKAFEEEAHTVGSTKALISGDWDLIIAYVKKVENSFDPSGRRILPNMSSLSIANLHARLKTHAPIQLTKKIAEETLVKLPADKNATFRRSIRFFDKLIAERARHAPIAGLLPKQPLGPLRTLRDAPIQWRAFPESFQVSMERMIEIAIRGQAPRPDSLAQKLGPDPLAARRARHQHRRKPVANAEVAKKSYKAALSWLARHMRPDREEVYALKDVRELITVECLTSALMGPNRANC